MSVQDTFIIVMMYRTAGIPRSVQWCAEHGLDSLSEKSVHKKLHKALHYERNYFNVHVHNDKITLFFSLSFKNEYVLHGHNQGIKQNLYLLPRECNKFQVNMINGVDVRAL